MSASGSGRDGLLSRAVSTRDAAAPERGGTPSISWWAFTLCRVEAVISSGSRHGYTSSAAAARSDAFGCEIVGLTFTIGSLALHIDPLRYAEAGCVVEQEVAYGLGAVARDGRTDAFGADVAPDGQRRLPALASP
jgi:hypothetical protein